MKTTNGGLLRRQILSLAISRETLSSMAEGRRLQVKAKLESIS